ncbi:MAG: hypothetical protein HY873_11310 [Chloroflexi bacterium]|nr:hypothetical protein [Chloroflexota bacterium]
MILGLFVVACGSDSHPSATRRAATCFKPDLSIETEPASDGDLQRWADRAGLPAPRLPEFGGLELRDAGILEDGERRGLSLNLTSEGDTAPAIVLRITPVVPCFLDRTRLAAAFSVSGVNVYRSDSGSLIGYVATLDTIDAVTSVTVTWFNADAPNDSARQSYVSTWLAEFKRLN